MVRSFNVVKRVLYDIRDNSSYIVRKLADGNCWMTQNLRYIGTTSDPGSTGSTPGLSINVTSDLSQGNGTVSTVNGFTRSSAALEMRYNGNTNFGAYYSWEAARIVCPATWHIPSPSEFTTIVNTYTTMASLRSTNVPNFILAGDYVGGGSTLAETSSAFYFSSTQSGTTTAYTFALVSSDGRILPEYSGQYKYSGSSVRCVSNQS